MKKLVSPLPWVGSKRRLRDRIIPLIPQHTCYAEPFAGGAWVYLGKQPSEVEVLNDINGDLVNLYKAIRDRPEELYDAIWHLLPSRREYDASKAALRLEHNIGIDTVDVTYTLSGKAQKKKELLISNY